MKKHIWKAVIVTSACIVCMLAGASYIRGNKIVSIKLAVGSDGYITMHIPQKYIGPSSLELPDQVIGTMQPVNMIPLNFTYPDFQPVKSVFERWYTREEEGTHSVFLTLEGGSGEKKGLNNFVNWRLHFDRPPKNCHAEPYPQKAYGLHRYKIFYDCLTPKKYHAEDLYFFDAPGDSERDVMIMCAKDLHKHQKCRLTMYFDDAGAVTANFSLRYDLLPHWREIVENYQQFVQPFYVNEIAQMKQSSARAQGEADRARDRWKP